VTARSYPPPTAGQSTLSRQEWRGSTAGGILGWGGTSLEVTF
jgi:hypothetical protein